MSVIVRTSVSASRPRVSVRASLRRALRAGRFVLGWPLRVHANRNLLHLMAGMSAHELADIGLTSSDLRDTAALALDTDVGHFLAARAGGHRHAAITHRSSAPR